MPHDVRWGHPDQWAGGRDEQERHRQELAALRSERDEARAQAEEFREAARKLVGVYMADGDLAECVAEMERLTGGQQG